MRVLVVDDEISTLDLMREYLKLNDYEVITTLNSTDALLLAELERPDCVLLDIMMPVLDGFTLCKLMRLHPATAHLPILFVTAYPSLDLEERRIECGADHVLLKPFPMRELDAAIRTACERRPKRTGLLRYQSGLTGRLDPGKLSPPPSITRPTEPAETVSPPAPAAPVPNPTRPLMPVLPPFLGTPDPAAKQTGTLPADPTLWQNPGSQSGATLHNDLPGTTTTLPK
jgi:CheY-like chemotaxis protein